MFKRKNATILYEVFHAHGDYFWTSLHYGFGDPSSKQIRQAFNEGLYRLEHTLDLAGVDIQEQLEEVFRLTNDGNCACGRTDVRSTSVGDVVRVGNQFWIVAPQGFDNGWQDKKISTPRRPVKSRLPGCSVARNP